MFHVVKFVFRSVRLQTLPIGYCSQLLSALNIAHRIVVHSTWPRSYSQVNIIIIWRIWFDTNVCMHAVNSTLMYQNVPLVGSYVFPRNRTNSLKSRKFSIFLRSAWIGGGRFPAITDFCFLDVTLHGAEPGDHNVAAPSAGRDAGPTKTDYGSSERARGGNEVWRSVKETSTGALQPRGTTSVSVCLSDWHGLHQRAAACCGELAVVLLLRDAISCYCCWC